MRRKMSDFLRRLFALEDTPERIARAFALGVFLAFSPLLGLHLFLGLIIAFYFGLNRFALLLGVFVNNPWTLIPIYAAGTYLGGLLLGFPPQTALPSFDWRALWSGDFWLQLVNQRHILKPLLLGSSILSVLVSAFSYIAALHMIRQRRTHQEKAEG
jgi:uncharacterized protein (DUF2062 family)